MSSPPVTLVFRIASLLFRKTKPRLDGTWFYQLKTEESSHIPYRGMIVRYSATVIQEGNWVHGMAEKIDEASVAKGTFEYLHKKRVQASLNGVIKFSLRRLCWLVELVIQESGHSNGRPSYGNQTLDQFSAKTMAGTFSATAADSSGVVYWSREKRPLPIFSTKE